jgi:arginine-tRNA-protein transferase
VPTRVRIDDFKLRRSQQRTLKLNQDLDIRKVQNNFKQEHFDLYLQYIQSRHDDSPMSQSTVNDYAEYILGTWAETQLLEFRLDSKLICVAVYDVLPQCLSAVYTFYDTAFEKRGLGTLAILQLIQRTKELQLPYLYLGYWIKACQKMSYKVNFKPIEGYIDKTWQIVPE